MIDDPRCYRLTIEDCDPGWAYDFAGRPPDVHGAPAANGHFWVDASGQRIDGYWDGAYCGGCGWRPDGATPSEG